MLHRRLLASRSGVKSRRSLHKYIQNFKLNTLRFKKKSCASPFFETAISDWMNCFFLKSLMDFQVFSFSAYYINKSILL